MREEILTRTIALNGPKEQNDREMLFIV